MTVVTTINTNLALVNKIRRPETNQPRLTLCEQPNYLNPSRPTVPYLQVLTRAWACQSLISGLVVPRSYNPTYTDYGFYYPTADYNTVSRGCQ